MLLSMICHVASVSTSEAMQTVTVLECDRSKRLKYMAKHIICILVLLTGFCFPIKIDNKVKLNLKKAMLFLLTLHWTGLSSTAVIYDWGVVTKNLIISKHIIVKHETDLMGLPKWRPTGNWRLAENQTTQNQLLGLALYSLYIPSFS